VADTLFETGSDQVARDRSLKHTKKTVPLRNNRGARKRHKAQRSSAGALVNISPLPEN
jgi:hypothetical protein